MYRRISLTTDLSASPASHAAFLHALALARQCRALLDIIHVHGPKDEPDWKSFPQVRATLESWGMRNLPAAIGRDTNIEGLRINKVEMPSDNAAHSVSHYVADHGTDIIVAASHGRIGVSRLVHGSMMEDVLQKALLPALLFGPEAKPFISSDDGRLSVDRVVFPVTERPSPKNARYELTQLLMGAPADVRQVHVRQGPSHFDDGSFGGEPVDLLSGKPAAAIVDYARQLQADLIVMATEGAQGLKEKMFGSTTSQVLAEAPCPVLVVPK